MGWDCRYSHYVPLDVWSDGDSVYALYGAEQFEATGGGGGSLVGMFSTLAVNDGDGWRDLVSWRCDTAGFVAPCAARLGGRIGDAMLALGREGELLRAATGGVSTPWPTLTSGVSSLFVVGERLAYAMLRGRVVRFDGTDWSPVRADFPLRSVKDLWAGPDQVWAVGSAGDVARYDGVEWERHDAGSVDGWSAVWSLAPDDVWIGGTARDLRRFDGVEWSSVPLPGAGECGDPEIRFLWGADGVLFAATSSSLARCTASEGCRALADFAGSRDPGTGECTGGLSVGGLWGDSPEEVFLALVDPSPAEVGCGGGAGRPFFAWWDGDALHWF